MLTTTGVVNSTMTCKMVETTEPPFWVVTGDNSMEDKDYENLKSGSSTITPGDVNDPTKMRDAFNKKKSENPINKLPKNSIVIKDKTRPVISEKTDGSKGREYMPVVVLSTPPAYSQEKKDINQHLSRRIQKGDALVRLEYEKIDIADEVPVGKKGYIYSGFTERIDGESKILDNPSIVPPGVIKENVKNTNFKSDFVFVLKKDAPFFDIPGVEHLDGTHTIELFNRDGKYVAEECVSANNPDIKVTNYIFKIFQLDENGNKKTLGFKKFNPDAECCQKYISSLMPFDQEVVDPLLKISKIDAQLKNKEDAHLDELLFLEGKKLVAIPQEDKIEFKGDQCYTKGPYGSYHYLGTASCDSNFTKKEQLSDSMLEPNAACAFMGTLKSLQEESICKAYEEGCTPQWGNLYYPKPKHQSHYSGRCMDFRPMTLNNMEFGGGVTQKSKGVYSREKTKILIQKLMLAGAEDIIFVDNTLKNSLTSEEKKLVNYNKVGPGTLEAHKNHIHVCFPEPKDIDALELEKRRMDLSMSQGQRERSDSYKNLVKDIERQKRMKNACNSI